MANYSRRSFLGSMTAASIAGGTINGCGQSGTQRTAGQTGKNISLLDGVSRENIKITDVTVTPLSYVDPKGNLWRSDKYIVWKTDAALCRVYTDQGIVGIGEGSPYAGPDNIKQYTEEFIKPAIVGKNPFDVEFLTCGAADQLSSCAWAGVDGALWDIIGKAKNMPVYKILAAGEEPNPHIRMYASAGDEHEWYNNGDEYLIKEAVKWKDMGFTAFKFRSGTDWSYSNMTMDKYIPIMRRLREAVGPDFDLMHETLRSQGVSAEEVLNKFCPVLEELKFNWFEQPMRTIEEYITINAAMPSVMVSGGESDRTRFTLKSWVDRGAIDIVQSDCNVTGITENWHIARMGHIAGKIHCPHNWHGGLTMMENAHFVAAIPNRHMLEINMTFSPLKTDVFKEPLEVKNGYLDLPDKPGFGLEVIDDVEKKFPFAPGSYNKPNPLMQP